MDELGEPMLTFEWVEWSNPVAVWWIFLTSVSACNILFWIWTFYYHHYLNKSQPVTFHLKLIIFLSGLYTFGCAFRSFLPRADVQRICLFDHWLSSVFVGRSVATVAELAFIAQWALVLHMLSNVYLCNWTKLISKTIFPLIFIAEIFSWYAVITTNYIGNVTEESLWTLSYLLILVATLRLWNVVRGPLRLAAAFAAMGCIVYTFFMITVDVPMYIERWTLDIENNKQYLSFFNGLKDVSSRWIVTRSIDDWRTEIPWMTLYFSAAVWVSLALCYVFKISIHHNERIAKD